MKHCSNPECPYYLKHKTCAEYVDRVATCTDCGESLIPGNAPRPMPQARNISVEAWKRLGVTVGAVLSMQLLSLVPMPGIEYAIDLQGIDSELPLTPLLFGVTPILSAFILMEIFAALIPGYRRLRFGGPIGRRRLRTASFATAFIITAVQSVSMLLYFSDERLFILPYGYVAPFFIWLCGTGLMLSAVQLIDRRGIGNGLGIFLLTEFGQRVLRTIPCFLGRTEELKTVYNRFDTVFAIGLLCVVVVAMHYLLRGNWETRTLPKKTDVVSALTLFGLSWQMIGIHVMLSESLNVQLWIWEIALLAVIGIIVSYYKQSRNSFAVRVANVVERCGEAPEQVLGDGRSADRAMDKIRLGSILFLALVLFTWSWIGARIPCLSYLSGGDYCLLLLVSTATVFDAVSDFRIYASGGNLIPIWPVERLYAVGPALRLLRRNSIAAWVKNANLKTLLQFSGPFAPIEILVGKEDAKKATALLYEALLKEGNRFEPADRSALESDRY